MTQKIAVIIEAAPIEGSARRKSDRSLDTISSRGYLSLS